MDVVEAKYNSNVFDFVQKLPGIHSKNIDGFMRSAPSLNEIVNKSEVEIKLQIAKIIFLIITFFTD